MLPKSIAEAETIAVRLETHKIVDRQRLQSMHFHKKSEQTYIKQIWKLF
jgi:hypothetical protein